MSSKKKFRLPLIPEKFSGPNTLGDLEQDEVNSVLKDYTETYDDGERRRRSSYKSFVPNFYDLVTDFYEFGWGTSFHFAPRQRKESFADSLVRHQQFLADRLSLKPGMEILDVGCGVGGPMNMMANYSGASFVGINNNAYQISRAKIHTQEVESLCRFIHADYMQIPEADNSYDGAFAIESMPHAPDKLGAFKEVFRVLRPGACFTGYDWCLTELFDPENAEHQRIKLDIERGDGLPDIETTTEVCEALSAAGFEIVESCDKALESDPQTPWFRALQGRDLSWSSIPRTPLGRAMTNLTLKTGEKLRLFPKGSTEVCTILKTAADALVEGGKTGIFTPMFYFLARKPQNPSS